MASNTETGNFSNNLVSHVKVIGKTVADYAGLMRTLQLLIEHTYIDNRLNNMIAKIYCIK